MKILAPVGTSVTRHREARRRTSWSAAVYDGDRYRRVADQAVDGRAEPESKEPAATARTDDDQARVRTLIDESMHGIVVVYGTVDDRDIRIALRPPCGRLGEQPLRLFPRLNDAPRLQRKRPRTALTSHANTARTSARRAAACSTANAIAFEDASDPSTPTTTGAPTPAEPSPTSTAAPRVTITGALA